MRLLASAVAGVAVALAVGLTAGAVPARRAGEGRRRRSRRQEWLVQAGLTVSPVQFRMASLVAAAGAFGVFLLISGVWTVAAAPAVAVAMLPRLYFSRVRQRRLFEVQRSWPDGIRDLLASISSGATLGRALETLAETGPEPLRGAFSRFAFLVRAVGVTAALEVIKEELADPTSDRVIEVLILAHERGGSIVPEILRDLAAATTRDVWTSEAIQTEALEQRINARVVFVLPWLVLVAITARQGAFREFYASPAGLLVVLIGAVMSLAGMVLVARLGKDPDEPRVLGGTATGAATGRWA